MPCIVGDTWLTSSACGRPAHAGTSLYLGNSLCRPRNSAGMRPAPLESRKRDNRQHGCGISQKLCSVGGIAIADQGVEHPPDDAVLAQDARRVPNRTRQIFEISALLN